MSEDATRKLANNIRAYHKVEAPFTGGKRDARAWWTSLHVSSSDFPLKMFAMRIFSIVPQAADFECLFSSLGGIQSVRRSNLTVPHMQTLGTCRNEYIEYIAEENQKLGKPERRQHAHMHTPAEPGIDTACAKELRQHFVGALESAATNDQDAEDTVMGELELAFAALALQKTADPEDGCAADVPVAQVYGLAELDAVQKEIAPKSHFEDVAALTRGKNEKKWNAANLLQELGIAQKA